MGGQPTSLFSDGLHRLIARNAPLWGGEAEVVRTYFDSPHRDRGSDRRWVLRQLYKEYRDGIAPLVNAIQGALPQLEHGVTREWLRDVTGMLHEEAGHYLLFAGLLEHLSDGAEATPGPDRLEVIGAWLENDALRELRSRHCHEHGMLGHRACQFTERGYCTLYSEGRRRKGRGGDDDAIAEVCAVIHDEEFESTLLDIVDLDTAGFVEAQWKQLEEMTVEQMRLRIRMRNAQFGFPVPNWRISELCAGAADPLSFDEALASRLRDAGERHRADRGRQPGFATKDHGNGGWYRART
jgi:hypothetical protein